MDPEAIVRFIAETCPGVDIMAPTEGVAAGDTFFIYDPDHDLEPQHQMPFATIVTHDYGEFDNASRLDREGVYRLNVGVGRQTFLDLFGAPSSAGGGDTDHEFYALDQLMPHPVYAPQWWVCVLNPSDATFERVRPLIAAAYQLAVSRHDRRRTASGS